MATNQKNIEVASASRELNINATGVGDREFNVRRTSRAALTGIFTAAGVLCIETTREALLRIPSSTGQTTKDLLVIGGLAATVAAGTAATMTIRRILRTNKFAAQVCAETIKEVGEDKWIELVDRATEHGTN